MDRNSVYEIFPQNGVSDIKFGMSPDDVENFWGAPARTSKNYLGDKTEVRDAAVVTYSQSDGCVAEIGFPSSYPNVTIKGVKVFQQPHDQTIRDLRALDQDVYAGDGFIVFNALCVSLSGFRESDHKTLTVTAFKRGWWDESIQDMARLS